MNRIPTPKRVPELPGLFCIILSKHRILRHEVKSMKEDEKKPISWEAADPKPPVIQSGHMESRTRNQTQ